MEPITREEYYLAKIAGTYKGKTPEPVTIDEYYLATMAGDYSGNTPQPVTRLQYYMAKVAGVWGGSIPAPVTRLEYYWAAIANGEGEVFPPVTREEHFLTLVADAYSVVLTVVTGNPALLEGVKGNRFTSFTIHGKSTQGSTTGTQLVNLPDTNATISNGITWECKNGIITANGTTTMTSSSISAGIHATLKIPAGDYYISGKNKNIEVYISIEKEDGSKEYHNSSFSVDREKTVTAFAQIYEAGVTVNNEKVYIMLNSGSTALPYEPYTGGKPSPSPEYPQEIESAGMDGEIGIEVGNNGYIQKGTYFLDVRPFSLKKGYTYHIKCEKIINTTINCFVMNEYNKNFKNSSYLYNYGYITKKLTIPNSTGIVDKECMMPKSYDGDGYTFTVKAEGLYLYQAVNTPDKNTDEFYIGYAPNILNEEYKKQTLIIPTPGGLPGIPVTSGGNYTDEKGQQWVADEIDLAKGERVQWIKSVTLDGSELWSIAGGNNNIKRYFRHDMKEFVEPNYGFYGLSEKLRVVRYSVVDNTEDTNVISFKYFFRMRLADVDIEKGATADDLKAFLSKNPITVYYAASTPIRTPLPPETIAAYKALKTYSPTTTVINDADAGMSVGYAKMK